MYKELKIYFSFFKEKNIYNFIFKSYIVVELNSDELKFVFFFKIWDYIFCILTFLVFIYCYIFDINFIIVIINYLQHFINLDFIANLTRTRILIIYLCIFLCLFYFLVRYKTKEDIIKIFIIAIYRRLNNLINIYVLLCFLNITFIEFLGYNAVYFIFFCFIFIIKIILIILKKNIEFLKIFNFNSIPIISLIFWILFFFITKDLRFYFNLYRLFYICDTLYYEITLEYKKK